MKYFHTTVDNRTHKISLTPKEANLKLLEIAAQGGSLAATAAFTAVEELPSDARQARCAAAAFEAAAKAVDQDWQDGGGMACMTILLGPCMRLAYKSCGRFRAIATGGGTIQVVIWAEDEQEALDSWRQRFPDQEPRLMERSACDLAQDGLGILL